MQLRKLRAKEWYGIWDDLPPSYRNVYSHPRYHEICAEWESVFAECLYLTKGKDYALYSYLRYPIPGFYSGERTLYDVQTAYGYGGPLFVGDWSKDDTVEALLHFEDYLRSNDVIAEFIRCNPDRFSEIGFLNAKYRVSRVRSNAECDLKSLPFRNIQDSWHKMAKRNVKKANKAGLNYIIGDTKFHTEEFIRLYGIAAKRLAMGSFYRFDFEYFESICSFDGELARLILVEAPGVDGYIAGAILFLGEGNAYYHLGASDLKYRMLRPNDFLFFAMAKVAFEHGAHKIVWGGGMSNEPDDSLYRFKRHFGNRTVPVHIACKAIDQERYDDICTQWAEKHPDNKDNNNLFLKYRYWTENTK